MSRTFQLILAFLIAPLAGAFTGWFSVAVLCLGDAKFGGGCLEPGLSAASFAVVSTLTCAFGFAWSLRPADSFAKMRASLAVVACVQGALLAVGALHLPGVWYWLVSFLGATVGIALTRREPALDT